MSIVDSDSGTASERLREEDSSNSWDITLISSGKLVNSLYLLLRDRPNAQPELGYKI
jgi:hypothetical protein